MRLVPNTETVPNSVNRYLLPHEHQVITVHRHPAVLVGWGGVALAGLVVVAVLSGLRTFSPDARLVVWLIWFLLVLNFLWKTAGWFEDYFVVTAYRVLVIKGFMVRDVAMLPIDVVARMRLRRSPMGRLLGYGEFIIESRGQDRVVWNVNFMPYPEQLYLEVCGLVYKDREQHEDTNYS
jgi:hypothetical protein